MARTGPEVYEFAHLFADKLLYFNALGCIENAKLPFLGDHCFFELMSAICTTSLARMGGVGNAQINWSDYTSVSDGREAEA